MKRAIAIVLATLFVFAFVAISFAERQKSTDPMPVERPKVKQITGEVKAVDTNAMTITVAKKMKDKVTEAVATVTDKTKIIMGKEKKTLSDVKVGNKVTLKYIEVEGKNTAKSIAIKPVTTVKKTK